MRAFHTSAMSYALQNLPVTDPLLCNASFLNFETKDKCNFSEVEYFAERYSDHYNTLFIYLYRFSNMLPFKAPKELDALLEEFINYKILVRDNVPSSVWEEALIVDECNDVTHHRVDIIWHYLYVQLRLLTIVSASIDFPKWLS